MLRRLAPKPVPLAAPPGWTLPVGVAGSGCVLNAGIEGGRGMTADNISDVSGVVDAGEKEIDTKLVQKRMQGPWSDAEKLQAVKYITSVWSNFFDNQTPHFCHISNTVLQQSRTCVQVRVWWDRMWHIYKAIQARDSDNLTTGNQSVHHFAQITLDRFEKSEIYVLIDAAAREDSRTDGSKDGHLITKSGRNPGPWNDTEKLQVVKYITSVWSNFFDDKTPHFCHISSTVLQQRKSCGLVRECWNRMWHKYRAIQAPDSDNSAKYAQRTLDRFKKSEIYVLIDAAAREDSRTDVARGSKDGHHSNAIQDDPNLALARDVGPRELGNIQTEAVVAPDRDGALGCGHLNRILESPGAPEGDFSVPQGLDNRHTAVGEADVGMDRNISDMIRDYINGVRHGDFGDSHVGLGVNQGPALGYGDLSSIGIGSNHTIEPSLAIGNAGMALANGYSDTLLGNLDGPLSLPDLERDLHAHFGMADAGIGLDGSGILGRSDEAYHGGFKEDFNIELDCRGLDDDWTYYNLACGFVGSDYMLQDTSVFDPVHLEAPAGVDPDTVRANSDVMLIDRVPDAVLESSDVQTDTAVHLEGDSHVSSARADPDTVRANSDVMLIDSVPDAVLESSDVQTDTAVHLEGDSRVSLARADSDTVRANSDIMLTDSVPDAALESSDVRIDTTVHLEDDPRVSPARADSDTVRANSLTDSVPDTALECSDVRIDTAVHLEGDSHVSPARGADSDTVRANSDVMLTDSDPDATPESSDIRIDTAVHLEDDPRVSPARADSDTIRTKFFDVMLINSHSGATPEGSHVRIDTAVHAHGLKAHADEFIHQIESSIPVTRDERPARNLDDVMALLQRAIALNESYFAAKNNNNMEGPRVARYTS